MENELKANIDKLIEEMHNYDPVGKQGAVTLGCSEANVVALAGIVRDLIVRIDNQNKAHQGTMALMFGKIKELESKIIIPGQMPNCS